jgi:uncharacterized membrane protein SpoIIM required for sporulation/uncharacterized RDD family membrane protein YckC
MVQRPVPPGKAGYRQHLEVETPEHVVLDYEIAGVPSRILAAAADWAILTLLGMVTVLGLNLWRSLSWLFALQLLVLFIIVWGYFSGFEGLRRGQTPGKRWLGIRVIRDTGHGVGFADAALRNLLLPADLFGFLGVFLIAIHPRAKRLGDLVAGTVVVRDQPARRPAEPAASSPAPAEPGAEAEADLGAPQLSDPEYRLLREFVRRAGELAPPVRGRLAGELAARFAERVIPRAEAPLALLLRLHAEEQARRRGRFGARAGGAAASVAERLVARKAARWTAFERLAQRVSREGLDALAAAELPEFAARYREIAADLARARTYRADPVVLQRLERLVAAGHNALYREDRQTWRRFARVIAVESPAAILVHWRAVTLAALAFLLPAVAGFALLRERPELAPELLPDVMLERAEAGATRSVAGQGYVEASPEEQPVAATSIFTNNVRVAFACFAGGIAFGVGALALLAFNGLVMGAISGHYFNAGLLGYLWTFVIGHAVLELFAIWVAGAAGFLLGRALIAPGELTRRDALVLAGRTAIRLIGAVVVLLLAAGLIEGFVSAGRGSLELRLLVSGGSLMALILYLLNGTRGSDVRAR